MTLDYSKEGAGEIVQKLIRTTDVFITKLPATGVEEVRLDYETLHEINPRLIYASLTGYGLKGEQRDMPGFDYLATSPGPAYCTCRPSRGSSAWPADRAG